jgi:hypothetical protein
MYADIGRGERGDIIFSYNNFLINWKIHLSLTVAED